MVWPASKQQQRCEAARCIGACGSCVAQRRVADAHDLSPLCAVAARLQNALARAYVDRVLTDAPRHAAALVLRGIIAAEEGDRNAARAALTAALSGEGTIDRAATEQRLRELDQPVRPRRR